MLNLNFACLKFLRLLQDCDVECNPGPRNFAIAKYSGFVPSGMPNLGKLLVFNVQAMHCFPYVGQLLNVLVYRRHGIWIIF